MTTFSTVLVTGSNGGLGTHFVNQALERGADKVYATARNPREWADPRVVPLRMDVTDPQSVQDAADIAGDVTLVINNAGTQNGASVAGDSAELRDLFEVNFFGPLTVAQTFAPALAANGGGALLNVLSVLSWLGTGGYSATKAALWSATNAQRVELAKNGTLVCALVLGYTDTPMIARLDVPKNDPAVIVRKAYEGLEAGEYEILADELSGRVKTGLAAPVETLYPQLRRQPADGS